MAVSYNRLWKLLIDKGLTKTELCKKAGITTTLVKICEALDCKIEDIMEVIPEKEA